MLKVTIITVTYNSEKYLEQCIGSVLSQDYPQIEYIVVDGNSGDRTLDIIRKYEPHITKWVSEPDGGMFDALNKGISMATGDIIGMLHSDDVFASAEVISAVVRSLEDSKADCLYGDLEYVDPDDMNILYRFWKGRPFHKNLFKKGWMPAHTTFYFRRELIGKFGNYLTHYYSSSDYELMIRFLYRYNASAYYLPRLIVKMRRGGLSNNSLRRRLRANRRDYLALKANGVPFPFWVSVLKPLSKLHQYFLR
jgi:glycosyltransferase